MNSAILAVVAIFWGVLVSIILILLVRQVSLMSVRLNLLMRMPDLSEFGIGPELGTTIPGSASDILPENGVILALSATCESCHTVASTLPRRSEDLPGALVVLLTGRGKPAKELRLKIPDWVKVLRDPDASKLGRELELSRTLWALRLQDNVVVGHADVSTGEDLLRLTEANVPEVFRGENKRNRVL